MIRFHLVFILCAAIDYWPEPEDPEPNPRSGKCIGMSSLFFASDGSYLLVTVVAIVDNVYEMELPVSDVWLELSASGNDSWGPEDLGTQLPDFASSVLRSVATSLSISFKIWSKVSDRICWACSLVT